MDNKCDSVTRTPELVACLGTVCRVTHVPTHSVPSQFRGQSRIPPAGACAGALGVGTAPIWVGTRMRTLLNNQPSHTPSLHAGTPCTACLPTAHPSTSYTVPHPSLSGPSQLPFPLAYIHRARARTACQPLSPYHDPPCARAAPNPLHSDRHEATPPLTDTRPRSFACFRNLVVIQTLCSLHRAPPLTGGGCLPSRLRPGPLQSPGVAGPGGAVQRGNGWVANCHTG